MLGIHVATPVFDGATEEDIVNALEEAGMDYTGKSIFKRRTHGTALRQSCHRGRDVYAETPSPR